MEDNKSTIVSEPSAAYDSTSYVMPRSSLIWDNYELSAEIIAMAPAKRKSIYGDYDAELTEILEEKYN